MDFDYVIVGAGSAGCVLANRLSSDPSVRVAVLEAGGPDKALFIQVPAGFSKLFKGKFDWDFTTTKQSEMFDREMYWARGKALGGSSAINAQMWLRGCQADYDAWSLPGWSYDDVLPYFRRAEKRVGTNRGGVYGTDGPILISELRDPNVTTLAFLQACEELGIPRRDEHNGPDCEGYCQTPVTQERGRRWSAADAYLRPALGRPNLTLMMNAEVSTILLDANGRATGVALVDGRTVSAGREVIVAGGTIGSPHLLMRSGIGDPEVLEPAGVATKRALPGVGRNLMDHLRCAIVLECPEKVTLASAESLMNLLRYFFGRTGMMTSNIGEAAAFIKTTPSEAAPDIELVFAPGPFINNGLTPPPGHGLTIACVLLQPESRGRVTIDRSGAVVIDPRYLTAPGDLPRLVAGLRACKSLFKTKAMGRYAGKSMAPFEEVESEADMAQFVRRWSESIWHPVGTCRMGTGSDAVVDPSLKVIGVPGLRVIDASVMPALNRGHTYAPTIMIAERGADLIKAA